LPVFLFGSNSLKCRENMPIKKPACKCLPLSKGLQTGLEKIGVKTGLKKTSSLSIFVPSNLKNGQLVY